MFRADAISRRLLQVGGGVPQPVYLAVRIPTPDMDLDRGIRGNAVETVTELLPRPLLVPLSGEAITRASSVLRLGDYQMEVSCMNVTEEQLRTLGAQIRVGAERFLIVYHEPKYTQGVLSYAVVYLRGLVES